jgi:hypothetical protein
MGAERPVRRGTTVLTAVLTAATVATLLGATAASASATTTTAHPATTATTATTPDLTAAVRYLVTTTGANGATGGSSLAQDGYYDVFPGFADFGLTMDGALALAAAGTDDPVLRTVVGFLQSGHDPSGRSVGDYTQLGTAYASGGAIAKEALVAESTGQDPRAFGGHDLVAGIDATACSAADPSTQCAAAGGFAYSESTFDQAIAVIAQLRAGDDAAAAPAVAYLLSLQHADGAFPSLLPDDGTDDVDSTGIAAMALALAAGDPAATTAQQAASGTAVAAATAWLAGAQLPGGGWTGTAGDSTNSAALAVQGLHLAGTTYAAQIARGEAFLATQQGSDGGFDVAAGTPGSDVRASAQAVGGLVGTSFATVLDSVTGTAPPTTAPPTSTTPTTPTTARTPAAAPTTAVRAVAVPSAPSPALPFSGADITVWSWLAAMLLTGGTALLLGARRLRRGAHR